MEPERDLGAALADVAGLGPYFLLETGPAEPGWLPLGEGLGELVTHYCERLGTPDRRVAGSILFQGLASRIWSPLIGCAAAHGSVPDLTGLRWRWAEGAPIGLLAARARPSDMPLFETAMAVLGPLREAWPVKLADGLVWGNAASALAGTRHAARVRPELGPRISGLVGELLRRPPLRGALEPVTLRRRSCCLYYKVPPGGGTCGDCPL
ncbi:(2Fe-2S)-binding protein [Actinocorallia longicatena]|uniref:Ferric siderophore reductase C-terminal domain-containing protein n=1 Tax=Actinocorallia longicatena TaxID=111803 RepID=A0ABP6Q207_9ACTN